MNYQLIIFDWDGTLMDSIDKIVICMQAAAEQEKQLIPTEQSIKNIIGLSLLKAMQQLFPTLSLLEQEALVAAYKYQYTQSRHIVTPLYDGVKDLLIRLKAQGYTLAVATGKGRDGLDRMLQQSATTTLFSATICADEALSKPNPSMINQLLKRLNFTADQALMVGDSCYDLEMAANAGVDSIGVSYGVHSSQTLIASKPVTIIDCLATQLENYI